MARIVSIHSFRGGTGKSNTTANLAALLAAEGMRVGVIDTDIQSPGIHILFGLKGDEINLSLNDYLWRNEPIENVAQDVTGSLGINGKLYLIPSSVKAGEITRILREGYDAQMLTRGLRRLVEALNLDYLLIDTHPGLNEETLLSIVISHVLLIVMRPDQQDYEGTGVTIAVARKLQVPHMMLVVNKIPPTLLEKDVAALVQKTYDTPVAAVLPHSMELMTLASSSLFVLQYPDHPVTAGYRQIAARLRES